MTLRFRKKKGTFLQALHIQLSAFRVVAVAFNITNIPQPKINIDMEKMAADFYKRTKSARSWKQLNDLIEAYKKLQAFGKLLLAKK